MNGIEKLTERITQDTDREREAILSRGKQQAAEIAAGYEALGESDYQDIVAQGKRSAEERVERLGSVAALEAKKLHLAAKQEMLDRTFVLATEKLMSLPDQDYVNLLVKLAVDGCTTGREALIFSVQDRPRYGKQVVLAANEKLEQTGRTGALTLSEESREFQGGLYIQDGNIENNCTFSTILRMLREQMAGEVAGILFEN